MPADTLATDGGAVTLAPQVPDGNVYMATGYAVFPGQDEVAVLFTNESSGSPTLLAVDGYSLSGSDLFHVTTSTSTQQVGSSTSPVIGTVGAGNIAFAWFQNDGLGSTQTTTDYAILTPSGAVAGEGEVTVPNGYETPESPLHFWTWGTGFALTWIAGKTGAETTNQEWVSQWVAPDGSHNSGPATDPVQAIAPEAQARGGPYNATALVTDNLLQYQDSRTIFSSVLLPNEPAHSDTSVGVSVLADGRFAVAWADSGTNYTAVYDPSAKAWGAVTGLDWGGADDVHVVSLGDGGFAVSWTNGGQYKGEVFGADGSHGGVMSLTGDFAGVARDGDVYTVGLNASSQYVVQKYAVYGANAGPPGSIVHVDAADYTAPDGVSTIYLEGSNQTIHANNGGDTIFSNDTGNLLYGGTGNDTFYVGRGGDWMTGGGGDDTFVYAAVPWAAGGITDFGVGDLIDLTGLLHQAGYDGDDPVGAHYLSISPTINGVELQVFAVGQLWNAGFIEGDGVSTSSLQVHGDLITLSGGGAAGQTFTSDDNGDTWVGTAGNDTFHLGRGGDHVTGGAGADTFAWAAIPWAGGEIADFNSAQGDRIDLTGLLANAGYSGADPFADGYLKYTTDASGNAQLWADYNLAGNNGWWLVATLDGVSTSSLHYANGLIT